MKKFLGVEVGTSWGWERELPLTGWGGFVAWEELESVLATGDSPTGRCSAGILRSSRMLFDTSPSQRWLEVG